VRVCEPCSHRWWEVSARCESWGVRVHCLQHTRYIACSPSSTTIGSVRRIRKPPCRIARSAGWRPFSRAEGRAEGRLERATSWVGVGKRTPLCLLALVAPSIGIIRAAYPPHSNNAGSHTTRCLQAKSWTSERSGIDSRHPNPRLVYLEQVCYKRVEIDIGVRKIVERQLFPIPKLS
jgi:hypothetical protein